MNIKKAHLLFILLFLFAIQANAKKRIPFCAPCEYLETVKYLPLDSGFETETGEPLNVGYKYEQFNLFWIPIWNKEGEYCFTNASEDTYFDMNIMDKALLTTTYPNLDLTESPLGFWSRIGGKLFILLLLGFSFYGIFLKLKEPSDKESETKPVSD